METDAPFEPWAYLTFRPRINSDAPPEPGLPTSEQSLECRVGALKAFRRDALVASVSQAPTNALAHASLLQTPKNTLAQGVAREEALDLESLDTPVTLVSPARTNTVAQVVAREQAFDYKHRSSAVLDALPLEVLLQIATHLPIHGPIALSHTPSALLQYIQWEATAKYLAQADTPTSGAGELAVLYLLSSLDPMDSTMRICVVCLIRRPVDAFHPWVAAHHVTIRSCTTYLRSFHRACGVIENRGCGRYGMCRLWRGEWESGHLSGPLERPAPVLRQYVPGCPYSWELESKWRCWRYITNSVNSRWAGREREAVAREVAV